MAYRCGADSQWDDGVLAEAIAQCGSNGKGVGEDLASCAPFKATLSSDNMDNCRYQNEMPAE